MRSLRATLDPRIGMVAASLEHAERAMGYGIGRLELVILKREEDRAVRRLLERTGASLSIHCPLFRDCGLEEPPLLAALFDTDPDRQEQSLRLMENELQQAQERGASHLIVHLQRAVGVLGEPVPTGWTEKRALDVAVAAAERLARAADDAGVDVHVENMMSQPLLARPESYQAFFARLSGSRIGMCLDIGHAALDAAKYGFDLLDFAALLAPWVRSLHVYDNKVDNNFCFAELRTRGRLAKYPVHPSRAGDRRWIDVAGVLGRVLPVSPRALVTFEVYFVLDQSREATQAGVDWIAQLCESWWRQESAA